MNTARKREIREIRYTVCATAYHHPDDPDKEPCRATLAVVDLATDRIVDLLEWDEDALEALGKSDQDFAPEIAACVDRWIARAGSMHGVKVISILGTPVPLEPCRRCSCDEWAVRTVKREDWAAMRRGG